MNAIRLALARIPATEPEPPVAAALVLLGGKVWTATGRRPPPTTVRVRSPLFFLNRPVSEIRRPKAAEGEKRCPDRC